MFTLCFNNIMIHVMNGGSNAHSRCHAGWIFELVLTANQLISTFLNNLLSLAYLILIHDPRNDISRSSFKSRISKLLKSHSCRVVISCLIYNKSLITVLSSILIHHRINCFRSMKPLLQFQDNSINPLSQDSRYRIFSTKT